MQSLTYPVLIFNKKFIQGQLNTEKDLCIRTRKSVEQKLFDDLTIIDSKGHKFSVLGYEARDSFYVQVKNIIDVALDFFLRPKEELSTNIQFELSEPEKVSFESVKQQLSVLMKKNPKWFDPKNENFKSIDDKLESYASLEELISLLAGYP
ncbi:hypothetical protein [Microbulbifer spongiae]|uniref:Uncharacterized protein n=1 Tax=Microbulbifer spongiae TaxID=2944933 RepID=A0ABY9E850_9GAMM|nr:hypothetical protein [Microbulbifer sp. MI-G]WKD48527.1 hypothetical protein M8T91_11395 [Microbulbifer sp. MI-G]